ncbi:hypothetical protein [Pelagibacterium halotolerans]|uniref:hypothetical protein n=1 Tax=Pelagibacterium halotolerans TaxID=531813 RepID=UPI00384FCD5D
MVELAAFAGRLAGTMIDPFVWIIALLAVWLAPNVVVATFSAIALVFGLGIAIALVTNHPDPVTALVFSGIATAIWVGIWGLGKQTIRRAKQKQ